MGWGDTTTALLRQAGWPCQRPSGVNAGQPSNLAHLPSRCLGLWAQDTPPCPQSHAHISTHRSSPPNPRTQLSCAPIFCLASPPCHPRGTQGNGLQHRDDSHEMYTDKSLCQFPHRDVTRAITPTTASQGQQHPGPLTACPLTKPPWHTLTWLAPALCITPRSYTAPLLPCTQNCWWPLHTHRVNPTQTLNPTWVLLGLIQPTPQHSPGWSSLSRYSHYPLSVLQRSPGSELWQPKDGVALATGVPWKCRDLLDLLASLQRPHIHRLRQPAHTQVRGREERAEPYQLESCPSCPELLHQESIACRFCFANCCLYPSFWGWNSRVITRNKYM